MIAYVWFFVCYLELDDTLYLLYIRTYVFLNFIRKCLRLTCFMLCKVKMLLLCFVVNGRQNIYTKKYILLPKHKKNYFENTDWFDYVTFVFNIKLYVIQ